MLRAIGFTLIGLGVLLDGYAAFTVLQTLDAGGSLSHLDTGVIAAAIAGIVLLVAGIVCFRRYQARVPKVGPPLERD